MSKMNPRNECIPLSVIDRIMKAYPDIEYEKRFEVKTYLAKSKIRTSLIREVLLE